jgi:hypothetical protein
LELNRIERRRKRHRIRSSAMSAWPSPSVTVAFGGRPFALDSITPRHHSPNVLPSVCAARSDWAYSFLVYLRPDGLGEEEQFSQMNKFASANLRSNQNLA